MDGNEINQALNIANASLAQVSNTIGAANLDKINRKFAEEQAEKQRQWNEEMWAKTNAWNYERWQEANVYNSPEAQKQRLLDAGLNPLFYGLDGTSANAMEASQPLGYERADYKSTINPFSSGLEAFSRMTDTLKGRELANAQIDKLKEDTKSVGLDNEWKDKTMEARTESEQLKNDVLRSDVRLKKQDLKNKAQEFEKLAAETDNEIARHGYILAQTALENAMKMKTDEETATIIALRPLDIQLKQAQTQAQKAAAAAQFANALYTNRLVDSGYIEKQVDLIASQTENYKQAAKTQEAQRYLTEFKNAIKSGNVFDFINNGQPRGWLGQFFADFGSNFFQFMSVAGEALSVVPGANSAFGAAFGGAIGSSSAPRGVADASTVQKQIDAMK